MSKALDRIAAATRGTEYDCRLWLVGGAVRDRLLGGPEPSDFDIVLETDAPALAEFLHKRGVSRIPPVTYPRFGTAMVQVEGSTIELVTARRESYGAESRKPKVEPATLEEDARRRDFTVNTLIQNLHTSELRDPLGTGLADLKNRVLRTPLPPKQTFYDDPLRMLRAVRFRWQLMFEPAPSLFDAIKGEAYRLSIISSERIRDEWMKMLVRDTASRAMQDLMDLSLLHQFAPEFEAMVGVEQGHYHHLDVWEHTLLVLDKSPRGDLILALAALLHDVGKPETRTTDAEGHTRFFSHEAVGASMARRMLQRLKFSNEQIDSVTVLVKNHMRLSSMKTFTATAARRLIRDLDEDLERLLVLVEADAASLKPGVTALNLEPIKSKVEEVNRATPVSSLESPLSGDEIMELLGLSPGPEVGKWKRFLLEKVLTGKLAPGDKVGATALVRRRIPET